MAARDNAPVVDQPTHVSNAARNALVILAVLASGAAMVWLSPIVTPLALAVFLMLMIDAIGRDLQSRAPTLGSGGALTAAVVICVVAFALIVYVVAGHAAGFAAKLAAYQPRLNAVLAVLARTLHMRIPRTVNALIASIDAARYLGVVAVGVQSFVTYGALVIIYVGFLLASRHGFERKIVRLFQQREERHEAVQVFLRVRDSLERYLWIQTLCGGIIAVGSWALMMAIGLEDSFFWAFLIFVIFYIPIVGAAVGIAAPAVFALLQFPTPWPAVFLALTLFGLAFIVGNILLPRLQGKSLNIDPVMILLSLAFWGSIWGVTGMFLSTPLTLLVMVILAQFEGTRWIAVLLSADGDPQGTGAAPARLAPARAAPEPA